MPARSSAPKPPKPPKPWRREEGVYRSADDRFTIEGGGAGRWFLTDAESLDELGLARTLGPYDTLDEAKATADGQRGQAAEASPLAERLAAARDKPSGDGATASARPARRAAKDDAADVDADEAAEAEEADAVSAPTRRAAAKPAPRSWLDELEDDDAESAARARRAVAALERLGVDDADQVVRRDVLGRQPAVAARLLGRSIAGVLRTRLEPGSLHADARRAIAGPMKQLRDADEAALGAYAAFVAARVLDAVLEVVAADDRADGAGRDLPGWRLMERPSARDGGEDAPRRLIVTPADVTDG